MRSRSAIAAKSTLREYMTDGAANASILRHAATLPTPPQPAAKVCGTFRKAGMSWTLSSSVLGAITSQLVHRLTSW